jgi:hypothetical protein
MTTFAGLRGVPAEPGKPEMVHNEKPSEERFWIVYETKAFTPSTGF